MPINDYSPFKLSGGDITQKKGGTDVTLKDSSSVNISETGPSLTTPLAQPFRGSVYYDVAGNTVGVIGEVDAGGGNLAAAIVTHQSAGQLASLMAVTNSANDDVVNLSTLSGIELGTDATDTATGRSISIFEGDGAGGVRFKADGTTGSLTLFDDDAYTFGTHGKIVSQVPAGTGPRAGILFENTNTIDASNGGGSPGVAPYWFANGTNNVITTIDYDANAAGIGLLTYGYGVVVPANITGANDLALKVADLNSVVPNTGFYAVGEYLTESVITFYMNSGGVGNRHLIIGTTDVNNTGPGGGAALPDYILVSGKRRIMSQISDLSNPTLELDNNSVNTIDILGTASAWSISTAGALSDGMTATTQAASDNSTKLATTAYVDAASGNLDTLWDASVNGGGGADYTTVAAAITAGKVRILVTGNTTETVAWSGGGEIMVWIEPGVNVNLSTDAAQLTSATTWIFRGEGTLSYAYTIPQFAVSNGSALANVENMNITNNSTSAGTQFCDGGAGQRYSNMVFTLPNFGTSGLIMGAPVNSLVDIIFAGGGVSSSGALNLASGNAVNLKFFGTFDTATANPTLIIGSSGQVTNTDWTVGADAVIEISGGQLRGLISNGAGNPNIVIVGNGSVLGDLDLVDGSVDVGATVGNQIFNVTSDGLLDMSDSGASENRIQDCKFDTAMTVAGNDNAFSNFIADAALTISGDTNNLSNVRIPNLVVSATASGNKFVNLNSTTATTSSDAGSLNQYSNCVFTGSFNTTGSDLMIDNSRFVAASTINTPRARISNSIFSANSALALSITDDNISVIGCRVGQSAGGGVGTITIAVGSSQVSVTACHTDVAIVDGNGDAGLANNFIY